MSLPLLGFEVPVYIALCLSGSAVSGVTLGWASFSVMLGQAPDPAQAGAWSFYGILISAIVVLFSTMALCVRWFVTYWLKAQQDMNDKMVSAMNASTDACKENTRVTLKQNEWFDSLTKEHLMRLEYPGAKPRTNGND